MYKGKTNIFAAILFLLLGMAWQPLLAEVSDPESTLQEGDKLYEADKYTEAIDLYTALYQDGYYTQQMLLRLSFMHEKLDNFSEAVYYLRKIDQEYGDDEERQLEGKVRNIMKAKGGRVVFSNDQLNFRLFFRNWGLIIYLVFGISAGWLAFNYLRKWSGNSNGRLIATIFSWLFFLTTGTLLFWRSFMVSSQAVIIDDTSFYAQPSYAAERTQNALSLGELVTIEDREDIWCEVSAGGKEFWVPKMAIREL